MHFDDWHQSFPLYGMSLQIDDWFAKFNAHQSFPLYGWILVWSTSLINVHVMMDIKRACRKPPRMIWVGYGIDNREGRGLEMWVYRYRHNIIIIILLWWCHGIPPWLHVWPYNVCGIWSFWVSWLRISMDRFSSRQYYWPCSHFYKKHILHYFLPIHKIKLYCIADKFGEH